MLSERQYKIFDAIVNDYINTAEPIGSRTIAKKFGVSSATIRNEMSDLEEYGLIEQLHASSGRVPSEKGYRLYVDQIVQKSFDLKQEEFDYLTKLVSNNINKIDLLMEETARAISILTNYTTVIIDEEQIENTDSIKRIQLMQYDNTSILITILTNSLNVRYTTVEVGQFLEIEELMLISNEINNNIDSINSRKMPKFNNSNKEIFEKIVNEIIMNDIQPRQQSIYTCGAKNLLSFKEFADLETAQGLFQILEEKETLSSICKDNTNNIQILIGSENDLPILKDCSIIKTKIETDLKTFSIGVIGPTRMDYAKTIATLNGITKNLTDVISSYDDTR